MLFGEFFSTNGFENLVVSGASAADRRNAVLSLIERNVDAGFGDSGFKNTLLERAKAAFELSASEDADASCRGLYSALSKYMGLTSQDAAGIAFLARYDPATLIDQNSTICGDLRLTAGLAPPSTADLHKSCCSDRSGSLDRISPRTLYQRHLATLAPCIY